MATKIRNLFLLAVVVVVVATFGPKLLGDEPWMPPRQVTMPQPYPTLIYEGTLLVFPFAPPPNAQAYRQAQRRPDKAVLVFRWRDNRTFEIHWHNDANEWRTEVAPLPGSNGITTFTVVVDVGPGELVGIDAGPIPPNSEGWAQCLIYHKGEQVDDMEVLRGEAACDYLIQG